MSKHRPSRQAAEKSLKAWADLLKAGTVSANELCELAFKLERVAGRESLSTVFGDPPDRLPRGRPRSLDAKCWEFLELLLQGKSKADAAQSVGLVAETLRRHARNKILGCAQTGQDGGETIAVGEVVAPPVEVFQGDSI